MSFFKRCRRLLLQQEGQSLVEFSLVLPLLLLFSIGTIFITLSFMHKSRMNALAYTSARAASVRPADFDANTFVIDKYKERSQQRWLSEVTPETLPTSNELVGVILRKPGERLDVLVNLVSGNSNREVRNLVVQMRLPQEYPNGNPQRTQTFSEIDYRASYLPTSTLSAKVKLIDALVPKALFNTESMADNPTGGGADLTQRDDKIGIQPPNTHLKNFYDDLSWNAYSTHDEKPTGTLKTQKLIGDHFKKLEAGGTVLDLIADLTPLASVLKGVFGDVAGTVAQEVEQQTASLTAQLDSDLKQSFEP
jgi:hypothetical protein